MNPSSPHLNQAPAKLLTIRQASQLRGITPPRLRKAIKDGELAGYQLGAWIRVRLCDVDSLIESMRYEPP